MQTFISVGRVVSISTVAALAMLAACDASRGTAIVSSGIQVDDAAVDFSDPFGGCQITTSSPGNDIFPLACSQRGAACTGGGSGSCGPEGCAQVFHAMCDHTCQVDADCPVPSTGDSRPVCQTAFHFCQLPCDDATACPSGYTCQASASWLPQDTNGNPLALPFLCMQTITVTSDGGI